MASQEALGVARAANDIGYKSIELTRESVLASQKAVDAALAANENGRKNIEQTEAMVKAMNEQLQVAKNDLLVSNRGLVAANMPALEPKIAGIKLVDRGEISAVEVTIDVRNLTDKAATHVTVACGVEGGEKKKSPLFGVEALVTDSDVVIMPREPLRFTRYIYLGEQKGRDAKTIKRMIDDSKLIINVYVGFSDTLGNWTNFVYGYVMNKGSFAQAKAIYNMSDKELMKTYFPEWKE